MISRLLKRAPDRFELTSNETRALSAELDYVLRCHLAGSSPLSSSPPREQVIISHSQKITHSTTKPTHTSIDSELHQPHYLIELCSSAEFTIPSLPQYPTSSASVGTLAARSKGGVEQSHACEAFPVDTTHPLFFAACFRPNAMSTLSLAAESRSHVKG